MKKKVCVGLFGTSGKSTWRRPFIEKLTEAGIDYFNPQVEEWTPACAEAEAQHLAQDEVLVYPILGETYGVGSLVETGFAVAQIVQADGKRHILLFIEPEVNAQLRQENPAQAKDSDRARKLALAHLKELSLPTVRSCSSLEDLLAQTLEVAKGLS